MKNHLSKPYLIPVVCFFLLGIGACQKSDVGLEIKPNPEATEINTLISGMTYDASAMLNVNDLGGTPSKRTLTRKNSSTSGPNLGIIQSCVTEDYNLKTNFDEVAIIRPTNGIVWPGALVLGNQSMLDGLPDPLTLPRNPVKLRLDLPGIGEKGNIVIKEPANSSVQTGIDEALEWWNANAYQDGYVNASNSSYQASTSYSSKQMSLDVGLNIEWATGSVASQLDYASSATKRVASMVYKQVFYTVTMDTPENPASVFGPDVSLTTVQSAIGSDAPPAYVNSVSYGRIIMFRMETTDTRTSVDLDAVLKYAAGVSGTATVNSTYDAILKNSSITVVTIGGNAEVASQAVSATGPGSLKKIITGKNALYSRDNPGVPIAYTVRYLKDNSFAKLGYTTDYKTVSCGESAYQHKNAFVKKTIDNTVHFRFTYKAQGSQTFKTTGWTEVTKNNIKVGARPPAGAHDVRIQFEVWDLVQWSTLGELRLNYINSDICYEAYCTSYFVGCTGWSIKVIGC
ncbi:thiol-activated cytolysin family protein [Salmonirosea aquatica]|uniref:Thiol-activated cytolysin n=1 Tax=Salmonirosea aquatica TaxID=2654236 RepID=A0A7C9FY24_9BACT|nr:hypothetical protein [Cytophagaceae bacterium SJW1-29]